MISFPQLRRVLMTTDTVGGVWNYALEMCRGLGPSGVEVVLATMGPLPSPEQRQEVEALDNVTLCASSYWLEWMEEPWEDIARAGSWLLELEATYSPDVIHLNSYAHGALHWCAPHLVVAHSCVLSWWKGVHRRPAPPRWAHYREAVSLGLQATPIVIAPTRAMADALVEYNQVCDRLKVIPNGREPRDYNPERAKEPFILSVGRMWDAAKNGKALAAVAPHLEWPIRVVGDVRGPDGSHQVLPGVETLGRCSPTDLADLYARAGIFVLPARYEPFGLSILEAALAGCALVLGNIPSLRELWADAAAFVPPDDHHALHRVLRATLRNSDLRARLAADANARARQYSSQRMIESYLDAYASLLQARALTSTSSA